MQKRLGRVASISGTMRQHSTGLQVSQMHRPQCRPRWHEQVGIDNKDYAHEHM